MLTTLVWSGVVAFIAYKIVDLVIGLRVTEEEEREGLDITSTANPRITPDPAAVLVRRGPSTSGRFFMLWVVLECASTIGR